MFKYFIFILFLFFFNLLNADESSLLSVKQQLDRLQREVNDLSKEVYSGVEGKELKQSQSVQNNSNLTALDLRIYDLENDMQKLNENFEELIFQIDDLKILFEELSLNVTTKSINKENISNNQNIIADSNIETTKNLIGLEENSLGNITINAENLSEDNKELLTENQITEKAIINLSPEEEFQQAFTLLRGQKYEGALKAFQDFKNNHQKNILSGSAHYWLGEIYLLNKEYQKAALEWGEGYETYPKSIKAPDMLYKLSESLVYLNKIEASCGALKTFTEKFTDNKLMSTVNNKIISLECN
jgi:tol-pal system protein YbgF